MWAANGLQVRHVPTTTALRGAPRSSRPTLSGARSSWRDEDLERLAEELGPSPPDPSQHKDKDPQQRSRSAGQVAARAISQQTGACSANQVVRKGGLEPPRFYPLAPQTSASTNSATCADCSGNERGSCVVTPTWAPCQGLEATERRELLVSRGGKPGTAKPGAARLGQSSQSSRAAQ